MPDRLRDRVAIITGGGSGYGAGIATKFVEEGAKVVIADLSVQNGERVAGELGCAFVQANVTKRADWEAVLKKALDEYGGVDIVVNNAGACYPNKVGRNCCAIIEYSNGASYLLPCSPLLKLKNQISISV